MADIDELLQLIANSGAEKDDDARPKKGQVQVDKFINKLNIRHGLDRVPTYVIFYTYRVIWKDISSKNKLNKITFFRLFNKMFEQKRSGKQRYYMLDASSFDVTRVGLEEAKFYEKRYTAENNKKVSEGKKRKVKISEPEQEL